MKRYLPFLIVGLVALGTFGGGFLIYRAKKLPAPIAQKDSNAPGAAAANDLHVRGPSSAPVTLEEFGDFECPPCGTMSSVIKQTEEKYGARLRVIFHHYPLAVHVHAREAALAAEAAHAQGRFWEMHDLLYKEQAAWSKAPDVPALFQSYAGTIGLNLDRFKKDAQGPSAHARVALDQKLGNTRGVSSTPTIFINDVALPPTSLNPTALHAAIDAALKAKAP